MTTLLMTAPGFPNIQIGYMVGILLCGWCFNVYGSAYYNGYDP